MVQTRMSGPAVLHHNRKDKKMNEANDDSVAFDKRMNKRRILRSLNSIISFQAITLCFLIGILIAPVYIALAWFKDGVDIDEITKEFLTDLFELFD